MCFYCHDLHGTLSFVVDMPTSFVYPVDLALNIVVRFGTYISVRFLDRIVAFTAFLVDLSFILLNLIDGWVILRLGF